MGRGGDNERSSSSLSELLKLAASDSACLFLEGKKSFPVNTGAVFRRNLPPKSTAAARGYNINVSGRLAALAPRVPHVGVPGEALRVAGESGDGVRASYLLFSPLFLTHAEWTPQPEYPSEFPEVTSRAVATG